VNFEPFCGNTKPVERPESRVEQEISREEAQSTYALRDSGGTSPPTRYAGGGENENGLEILFQNIIF
jgi:hypothetical protein